MAEPDDEHPIGSQAKGRGKGRIEPQAAVGVIARAHPNRGKEERDGRGSQGVDRGQAGGLHADQIIGARAEMRAFLLLGEDHRAAGGELGGGDTDGIHPAGVEVAANAIPGDGLEHELLQGPCVQESEEAVGSPPFAQLLSDLAHAKEFARHGNQVSTGKPENLSHVEVFPDLHQPRTSATLLVCRGGNEGRVDGAHRGSAYDVEMRVDPVATRKVIEDETENAGLIGAARTAAGKNHRTPGSLRGSGGRGAHSGAPTCSPAPSTRRCAYRRGSRLPLR